MVAGFEAEYPGVKVNLESTSMDNYQDVIKLKISTGDATDIIFGSCKVYSDLVQADCIKNLAAQDIAKEIEENKVSAWISVGTFSGLYDSTWYTVLQDYALTDNMTVEQFCARKMKRGPCR